jgi:ribonuclease P protein component
MLAKSERLSRVDFSSFFKSGKHFHSDVATIVFSPTPTVHGSVVISKKVFKRAVDRNLARRRVYALLQSATKHNNQTGVYIVVLKPAYKQLTKAQSLVEIQTLIERTRTKH